MWSLILYSLFQGVPKFCQSQTLKCLLVGIFHSCGKMRRIYLCAGAVCCTSQIRPMEEWCHRKPAHPLLFINIFGLFPITGNVISVVHNSQVSPQFSLFADMKIHFSGELEVHLSKVRVLAVCVGVLPWPGCWDGRNELGQAALICGKATGAPSLCHWWLLLLACPKPWGDCNAIVQAAGELGEERRGAWWSKLTGNGGGCVGPKNYLSNKPTHKNKWEQETCQLIKKAHTRKHWGWASEAAWQAESQCIVVLPNFMYKMFSVPKVGLSHRSAVPCLPARALLGVLLLLWPLHRPVDAGRLRREQMLGWSCRTALGCTAHSCACAGVPVGRWQAGSWAWLNTSPRSSLGPILAGGSWWSQTGAGSSGSPGMLAGTWGVWFTCHCSGLVKAEPAPVWKPGCHSLKTLQMKSPA